MYVHFIKSGFSFLYNKRQRITITQNEKNNYSLLFRFSRMLICFTALNCYNFHIAF